MEIGAPEDIKSSESLASKYKLVELHTICFIHSYEVMRSLTFFDCLF